MLVKFKNDSPEFEKKVEKLKEILSVGAASKVAEHCVNNYLNLDDRNRKLSNEIHKLKGELNGIVSLLADKRGIQEHIDTFLDEQITL